MRIAVPLANGRLSLHFGHCEEFALIDADPESKTITAVRKLNAPPHEPGRLPLWLAEKGAQVIVAGGMGQRAQGLFEEQRIEVVTGAAPDTPENIAAAYLSGSLRTGENVCDH